MRNRLDCPNERMLSTFVPPSKVRCSGASRGSATQTELTTWVVTVPSLRKSFSGRAVLKIPGMSAS